jgi:hypothetical protein
MVVGGGEQPLVQFPDFLVGQGFYHFHQNTFPHSAFFVGKNNSFQQINKKSPNFVLSIDLLNLFLREVVIHLI